MFFYLCEELIQRAKLVNNLKSLCRTFLTVEKHYRLVLNRYHYFIVILIRTKLININNETETKVQSVYHRVSKRIFLVLLK